MEEIDYTYMLSPLVVVSGVESPVKPQKISQDIPLDHIEICDENVENSTAVQKVSHGLLSLSQPSRPWEPKSHKEDKLHFLFQNSIDVPSISKKPSPLSPKNDACQQPIFTVKWLKKYTCWIPAVSIVFCSLPVGEEEEEELAEALIALREKLAQYGTFLVVVITGSDSELTNFIPYFHKRCGISSKYGLFSLPNVLSDVQVDTFVSTMYQTALTLSHEFFQKKSNSIREKRNAVMPPLDLLVWDARFTLKLAYCSEFKGDLARAIKLYESAYDSLALLFEKKAITIDSPAYINSREVLDVVALKIFQHTLPSKLAYEKLIVHLATIEQFWVLNHIDKESKNALLWRAAQYAGFAQLCTSIKQTEAGMSALAQQPAGTPTGLIWLDSAKLFTFEPKQHVIQDPYSPYADDNDNRCQQYDPQLAFLNAISDLSEFKRAKAYALVQYGNWLSNTDSNAALQAYKSASQALNSQIWPEVQRYLSKRLDDRLSLFKLGEINDFPEEIDLKTTDIGELFTCEGTFESPNTHVGREILVQVKIVPKFSGRMTLDSLCINHSLGSVSFQHSTDVITQEYLVVAPTSQHDMTYKIPTNLEFDNSQPCTFQFSITSVNTGDIILENVEITAVGSLTSKLSITAGLEGWLTSPDTPSPRTIKHLPAMSNPLKAHVDTRPAKLDVIDQTPTTAAVGEKMKFSFIVKSREEETITPEITVKLIRSDATDGKLVYSSDGNQNAEANGGSIEVTGNCNVPSSVFVLLLSVRFNTSTDKLPVVFELRKEVDVVKPFRVSFDLVPEYFPQNWPSTFAPTCDFPPISRKWRLNCTVLSLFSNTDIMLHSSSISIECELADFDIKEPVIKTGDSVMSHNSMRRIPFSFLSCPKSKDALSIRTVEALAHIKLMWSRISEPNTINSFELLPVRLNLPTQEPRVLVVANKKDDCSEFSQVTYHIENTTARLLNFSISMSSSTYFAFQGHKFITLRMLPFSTRALTYQLIPLGDGAVQNKRPLPELRVYDINYKRTLAILPGDKNITYEQNSLFL